MLASRRPMLASHRPTLASVWPLLATVTLVLPLLSAMRLCDLALPQDWNELPRLQDHNTPDRVPFLLGDPAGM